MTAWEAIGEIAATILAASIPLILVVTVALIYALAKEFRRWLRGRA